MLNSLFTGSITDSTVLQILLCTLVSLALGGVCGAVYMFRNPYNKSFVVTLVLLPAIVQMIILLVNGNIGTGVAVAGAFSLVRFRSLPGTAREIGAIFLAMAVGLATGTGYLALAALFVVILGGASLLLTATPFAECPSEDQILRVTLPEALEYETLFDDLFAAYTGTAVLESVKTTNMGSLFELQYRVRLRKGASGKAFLDALRTRNGNLPIHLARPVTRETQL